MMAEKIASMYAEISADASKLKKGLADTKGGLKEASKDFAKFKMDAIATFGLIGAGVFAAKKAFEFGKEGAQLEFVREKFDKLSMTVGRSGESMLADLRKVTRGMVSDSELIASAGDFMSLGLAKTSDQVVRLTRVAGALNMDMNQLVLTLANKTTMRFDQLGVAVDGFDQRLNNLKASGMDVNEAFTEAFLQQAEDQIKKVGDVADTGAGDIRRMEVAIANMSDTLKRKAAPAVADFADLVADLLSLDAENWFQGGADASADFINSFIFGKEPLEEFHATTARFDSDLGNLGRTLQKAAVDMEGYTQRVYQSSDVGAGFALVVKRSQEEIRRAGKAAAEEAPHLRGLLDVVDRKVASPIAEFIKDLEWFQAGGWRINAAFEALKRGLESGAITPEEAMDWAGELLTVTKDIEVELDETTLKEAAQSLNENIGMPIKDAKNYITGTDGIAGALEALTHAEYLINVKVNYIADLPPGVEAPVEQPKKKKARAAGGPVWSGQAFLVGERGPEIFIPTSNGQIVSNDAIRSNTTSSDVYVVQNFYDQGAAALGMAYVETLRGQRLDASMGR